MSMVYCPKCSMNVYSKEEDFNIPLAIFLAIFTGGIGLLIYLAIYMDKKNKCIHCNTVCKPQTHINQPNSTYQSVNTINQSVSQKLVLESQKIEEKPKYCYNCGTELNRSEDAKFCALCGSAIQ
ncbi:MAG: hypothetical protein ACFE75_00615 [Candidatus Hodarchaeota archaeon]